MKRFRWKIVSLGLVLGAGGVVAAEGEWRVVQEPPPPAQAAAPAGAPGLPPAVRGAPAAANAEPGPIWLPVLQSPGSAPVTPPGGVEGPVPVAPPIPQLQGQPIANPVEPRTTSNGDPFGALPAIPVPLPRDFSAPQPQPYWQPPKPQPAELFKPTILPPQPQQPMGRQPAKQSDPFPPPRPIELPVKQVNPKDTPRVPDYLPPAGKSDSPPAPLPLPLPTPVDPSQPQPQSQGELPRTPAPLAYPGGVGYRHGTFGSLPLSVSRDYPALRDLIYNGHDRDAVPSHGDGASGDAALNRYFLSGEYLLWWMPGYPTPILATTNANTALNGFLGEPGTMSLFGPGSFIGSTRSGFRVRGGAWLNDCRSCGIDGSFFFLGRRSDSVTFSPDVFPLITRPVFVPNVNPGTGGVIGENGEFVALPGTLRGTLSIQGDSQLLGADVNLRKALCRPCDTRAEVFAGFRYLNLRERLTITENITVIGLGDGRVIIPDPIGTNVTVRDQFQTRNEFYGGQIGGMYERRWGSWDVNTRASVALGTTHQVLDISGIQVRQRPGVPPMTFTGGLLAAGPNLGRFVHDRFSVVPELTLNVGYRVTNNIRVFAGYNFLLWTNVIRPGDQIDRVIDLAFVPNAPLPPLTPSGLARPRPLFAERDLIVQGVQFGVEWRW